MRTLTAAQRVATRYIPASSTAIKPKDLPDVVIYAYTSARSGKPAVVAYLGTSAKPALNFVFRSPEERELRVQDWLSGLREVQQRKAKAAAAKRAWKHGLKPGDMLYGSWGYDQTNPEFYQVVRVEGARVIIRAVTCETIPGSEGFMSDRIQPVLGNYYGPELTRIPQCSTYDGENPQTYIKLHESCDLHPASERTSSYRNWYA